MRKIFPGNEKKAGVTGDSLLSAAMTALVDEPVTARLSFNMKGYVTDSGYMGYVDGRYVLFASESDYIEYSRN